MKEASCGGLQAFEGAAGLVKAALACMYVHSGTVEWDMLRQIADYAVAVVELEQEGGKDLDGSQELSKSLTEVRPTLLRRTKWISFALGVHNQRRDQGGEENTITLARFECMTERGKIYRLFKLN